MNKLTNKLNSQKGQSGFTIIEVLIVLAIGALIILAVLLAVPALQNNQRNSARKADASRIASALTAWASDNNNADLTGATAAEIKTRANVGNSQLRSVDAPTATVPAKAADLPTTINTAYIYVSASCVGTTPTTLTTADKTRAVVYYVNDGGGSSCVTAN
ncbi:prepilin-type N-terminal cleavage/methylation domain-containing protein [bacterium]|nr:prepilin-type N-terminal cleavage/methylation domain-containing protein [bacterium]